ncbi:pimeloyl-ACP methyl ester carboxylesterase [Marmoricola sp. OAE513]|uniref:alpha/beta hydrolase n=1 Tax=Marmoricola sp. OAE513 TaxID=2817894 RepID=UPI001AEA22C1
MSADAATPPLLLVHGAWHGSWCWHENFVPYFEALGYDVHTVDLREHGRARGSQRLGWHSVADYVADVRHAVEKLDRPPVLVAHSMGGFVLQKYLEKFDAAGAVLVASVPPRGVIGVVLGLARKHPARLARALTTFDLYPIVAGPERTRKMFFSDAIDEDSVRTYAAALGNESYRAFLDMLVLKLPRRRRIRGKVPMLVLGGELDRIFPPGDVRATAAAYGTAPVLFDEMAHDLMLEVGWERVADTIDAWVSDLRRA